MDLSQILRKPQKSEPFRSLEPHVPIFSHISPYFKALFWGPHFLCPSHWMNAMKYVTTAAIGVPSLDDWEGSWGIWGGWSWWSNGSFHGDVSWLVVYLALPLWKMMEWVKVSWDDEIPIKNGKNVPNHQTVMCHVFHEMIVEISWGFRGDLIYLMRNSSEDLAELEKNHEPFHSLKLAAFLFFVGQRVLPRCFFW